MDEVFSKFPAENVSKFRETIANLIRAKLTPDRRAVIEIETTQPGSYEKSKKQVTLTFHPDIFVTSNGSTSIQAMEDNEDQCRIHSICRIVPELLKN